MEIRVRVVGGLPAQLAEAARVTADAIGHATTAALADPSHARGVHAALARPDAPADTSMIKLSLAEPVVTALFGPPTTTHARAHSGARRQAAGLDRRK